MGYKEGEVLFVLLTIGKVKRNLYLALKVFKVHYGFEKNNKFEEFL
jgi:hypothetical protein